MDDDLEKNIIIEIDNNKVKDKDKDKTFNRLKELQSLIKKESALNELCK